MSATTLSRAAETFASATIMVFSRTQRLPAALQRFDNERAMRSFLEPLSGGRNTVAASPRSVTTGWALPRAKERARIPIQVEQRALDLGPISANWQVVRL